MEREIESNAQIVPLLATRPWPSDDRSLVSQAKDEGRKTGLSAEKLPVSHSVNS